MHQGINRRVSIVGVAHGVLQLRDERVDIPAEIPNIDREEYNVAVCGGSSQASNLESVGREHEKGVSALERRSVNQKLIDVARCGTPVPGLVLDVSNCLDLPRPAHHQIWIRCIIAGRANEILRKASAYFAQAEFDRRGK